CCWGLSLPVLPGCSLCSPPLYRKSVLPHLSPFGGLFWSHKVCCPLSLPPAPWACLPRHSPLPGAHQGHHPHRGPVPRAWALETCYLASTLKLSVLSAFASSDIF
uniref:Uncharacterized protein n=1 Tax=Strix occidentalis caurina TaxID=311401 RepID=A0A8D0FSE1_STROC